MTSTSLDLYYNETSHSLYDLQSSSNLKTRWVKTGYPIGRPNYVEIERKFAPVNSLANDHVILRLGRWDTSTYSPYKPTMFLASLDLSIPRDQSGSTQANMQYKLSELACILNGQAAMSVANASNTFQLALIQGRDL